MARIWRSGLVELIVEPIGREKREEGRGKIGGRGDSLMNRVKNNDCIESEHWGRGCILLLGVGGGGLVYRRAV